MLQPSLGDIITPRHTFPNLVFMEFALKSFPAAYITKIAAANWFSCKLCSHGEFYIAFDSNMSLRLLICGFAGLFKRASCFFGNEQNLENFLFLYAPRAIAVCIMKEIVFGWNCLKTHNIASKYVELAGHSTMFLF